MYAIGGILLLIVSFANGLSLKEESPIVPTHGHTGSTPTPSDHFTNSSCEENERCVPYYHCLETDGGGIFNIRSNADFESPCDSLQKCCGTDDIKEEIPDLKPHDSCGYRNAEGLGTFSLGKDSETKWAEFPWMMAVLKKVSAGASEMHVYVAGGSLIHPSIVTTTAHNIQGIVASELRVRGGEWNTQSTDELLPHVDQKVKEITYHQNFTRANLQNDIALMFLEKPFEIAPHINTICLPHQDYHSTASECIATGWGKKKFGAKEQYQVFLKKVEVPIVPNDICEKQLRKTRLGEDFELHEGFLCAGGEDGIDTCTGDGGSPLVCPMIGETGYYYQAGIVVGGIGCGDKDVPAFYLNLSKYRNWIDQEAAAKGIKMP